MSRRDAVLKDVNALGVTIALYVREGYKVPEATVERFGALYDELITLTPGGAA